MSIDCLEVARLVLIKEDTIMELNRCAQVEITKKKTLILSEALIFS